MRKYFKYLRDDKLVYRLQISAFIFIVLTFIVGLISYTKLPPLVPVFNQLPWGPERLGNTWGIFIPPILVFAIFAFNIFVSGVIYSRSALLSRMLAVTSLLITLLTLLFIVRTVILVI